MNTRILAATFAAAFALGAPAAMAQDHAVITINNESSATMTELNISEPGAEEWEANILESEIAPGETLEISVDPESCEWDIQAVYDDGDTQQDDGIDLCALDGEEFTVVDAD